jgi:putative peptidoglycan lipid II flippase
MTWVALFVLVGKLIGAAKEMLVAYRYGVSAEVDAFLFVTSVISWPVGVWSSVLTLALVPLVARIRQEAREELPRFRAELLGITFLLGLLLAGLTWVALLLTLRSSRAGLLTETAAIAADVAPVLIMLMPVGLLSCLFSAWMLADGRHVNTLMEGIPTFVVAIAILAVPTGGIGPLVWGTVVGLALHLIGLAIAVARHGKIGCPRFRCRSTAWRWFWQDFSVMLVGNSLMHLIIIADLLFAARLGTGAIATLSYANRILFLILGLGGTAISRATLPVFSNTQGQGRDQVHRLATQWVYLMLALGTAAMVVVWLVAPFAVKLLFERGEFTAKETLAVAEVLRYGAVQLPFYLAALVLVSSLVSKGMYTAVAVGAAINLIVKVAANYLFVPVLGINGIILSTGLMYMVSFAMLCFMAFSIEKRRGEAKCDC